jgi:hypothetical protein
MATTMRAHTHTHIYIYGPGGEFCQVSIFAKLICQTVGGQFFLFLPKLDGCQVGLPNCWSRSNKPITQIGENKYKKVEPLGYACVLVLAVGFMLK